MAEGLIRPRAEILGRIQLGEVEFLERGIEGQRGEREVDVDQDDEDGEIVVDEQRGRVLDDAGGHQELVERPFLAKDGLPGVHTEQIARPERNDHRQQHGSLEAPAHIPDQEIRERQRDRQARRGHRRCHHEGLDEGPDVGRLIEEPRVVAEVPLTDQIEVVVRPPEAEDQHDAHRDHEEQREHRQPRQERRRALDAPAQAGARRRQPSHVGCAGGVRGHDNRLEARRRARSRRPR